MTTFIIPISGRLIFSVLEETRIYSSDGTADSALLLMHAESLASMGLVGPRGLFWTMSGDVYRLYASDGTAAGTELLASRNSAISEAPYDMGTASTGHLFRLRISNGFEIYSTDGTAEGTHLLATVNGGPLDGRPHVYDTGGLGSVGAHSVFWTLLDGVAGIYGSDGTAAGAQLLVTVELDQSYFDSDFSNLGSIGAHSLFSTRSDGIGRVYSTDGTAAGTQLLVSTNVGTQIHHDGGAGGLGNAGTRHLFHILQGDGRDIYSTDGTAAGTLLLMSVSGTAGGAAPGLLAETALRSIFRTNSGGITSVYGSDGTASGTQLLAATIAGGAQTLTDFGDAGARNLFHLRDANGHRIYGTDGTTGGTQLLMTVKLGTTNGSEELGDTPVRNIFYTVASGVFSVYGSNGTTAGTQLLAATNGGTVKGVGDLGDAGSLHMFHLRDKDGYEIYGTDGTTGGTQLLMTIKPGATASGAGAVGETGQRSLFWTLSSKSYKIYGSDGTVAGTQLLATLDGSSSLGQIGGVGAIDYFYTLTGTVYSVYATDGTVAGTQLVKTYAGQGEPVLLAGLSHTSLASVATASLGENSLAVATIQGTSPLPSAVLSYAIDGGVDSGLFVIDGVTGALNFKVAPDYEAPGDVGQDNVYNLTVSASDGVNTTSQAVVVTVTDVNDAPVITSGGGEAAASCDVDEAGVTVATVVAVDADAGAVVSYAIVGGADSALFQINALTGVLQFKVAPDFETPGDTGSDNVYDVVVRVDDGALYDEQALSVRVGDVLDTFTGTPGNDTYAASSAYDWTLSGLAGDDVLAGQAGRDRLDGGDGDDQLLAGFGDSADGGTGVDTLSLSLSLDGAGGVAVDLSAAFAGGVAAVGGGFLRNFERYQLIVGSAGADKITLGNGAELVDGAASGYGVYAGDGDDVVTGGAAGNTLFGEGGNDLLDGGGGADVMMGGTGDDTYVVDNAADKTIEAIDDGIDTVRASRTWTLAANLENLTLTGNAAINGTGNGLGNLLTGNGATNVLAGLGGDDTYVVDAADTVVEGSGGGNDTVLAAFSYVLGTQVENLSLTGNAAINGTGNALSNFLRGNAAANVLTGLAGNDTYVIDNAADKAIEAAGEGTDTVQASINFVLGANIERLTLIGAANIAGTGNELANEIRGNSGNNKLDGGTGADTLIGGLGNDIYTIDEVGDKAAEAAGEGLDQVNASVSFTLGSNVENLLLTGAADLSGIGNGLNNVIWGNDGANRLDGLGGADKLLGGLGNDTYVVDNVADKAEDVAGGGIDIVLASNSHILSQYVEKLTLTGSANITATGNAMDNILVGNSGNNRLTGGAGADGMTGGAGHDTYYVDNESDTIVELLNQGIDLVQSTVSYVLSDNIDNLFLNGSGDLNGTGNAINNLITGTSGNNVLDGQGGIDKLFGGLGDDTYYLDNSSDSAKDEINGGHDVVYSSASWVMTAYVEDLYLTGSANITGTGNALANILSGNDGNNKLDGGTGNDSLTGGLGSDSFMFNAGSGIDVITDFTTADTVNLKAYSHGVKFGGGITVTQTGADVLIDLGGGNTVIILNSLQADVASHIFW